jgi:hypothetical protein
MLGSNNLGKKLRQAKDLVEANGELEQVRKKKRELHEILRNLGDEYVKVVQRESKLVGNISQLTEA